MFGESKIDQIPILDFSQFLKDEEESKCSMAAQLRRIQEEVGFYYIVNHGVPSSLIDRAINQVQKLHSLPLSKKLELKVDKDTTGYIPIKSTMYVTTDVGENDRYDLNENYRIVRERPSDHPSIIAGRRFTGPNKWPSDELLPNFKNVMLEYYTAMEKLGHAMLPFYARALDLPVNYFAEFFTDPMWFTRNVHYPTIPAKKNQFGISPHSDHGFITLLPLSKVPGLEVKTQDGRWISGGYVKDAIVVNSGDFMKKWTNGRFIATPHRVLPPKEDRYISAFFFNPNWDVMSSPLPTCIGGQDGNKYDVTSFYDHLCNYVDSNYTKSSGGNAKDPAVS
ncbi:MAG: 2-oxoglutarate and iron-dependent oxygenase domain-containing protein [Pseudomonadota bacterium]|nr:2-oxoglutarate and iron-dependent oxygenase domain-containing protein [Pseudomonadota bacterium]